MPDSLYQSGTRGSPLCLSCIESVLRQAGFQHCRAASPGVGFHWRWAAGSCCSKGGRWDAAGGAGIPQNYAVEVIHSTAALGGRSDCSSGKRGAPGRSCKPLYRQRCMLAGKVHKFIKSLYTYTSVRKMITEMFLGG